MSETEKEQLENYGGMLLLTLTVLQTIVDHPESEKAVIQAKIHALLNTLKDGLKRLKEEETERGQND